MKRFIFRLEALLKYKTYLEQMARQEMAGAIADVSACEQQIQSLGTTRKEAAETLEESVSKGIDARAFQQHHAYIATVERMIRDEQQRKQALEKVVEEKRAMLKKRTIDKKAMERLREKRAQEYTSQLLDEEQKELDGICALKTAREIANETH